MSEMQAYCQLEAIELSWLELLKFAHARQGDLDALIAEHRMYLRKVAGRVFLLNPRDGPEVCDMSLGFAMTRLTDHPGLQESLLDLVKELMELIMTFGMVAVSGVVALKEDTALTRPFFSTS